MGTMKFVLVGTGNMANTYVAATQKLGCAEIVAVISRSAERAAAFAADNGIANAATSLQDVTVPYDGVYVTSPQGSHHRWAIEVAGLGKHVLVEKPLDVNDERMTRMITVCRDAGVKLGAAYQRRTRENNRIIRNLVAAGAFGRILAVDLAVKCFRPQSYYDDTDWRGTVDLDGGGPFMQQGSHDIDLYCWIFGLPRKVLAKVGTLGHANIEVEDHGVAILELDGGGIATIIASTLARPGFAPSMHVFTERGGFTLENDAIGVWDIDGMDNPGVVADDDRHSSATSVAVHDTSGHEAIIQDFVEAVEQNREPLVHGETARLATDLIQAIYRSAREGREILL